MQAGTETGGRARNGSMGLSRQAAFTILTSVGRLFCFTSIFLQTGSDAAGLAKMKFS
jgi:hypothetical protein